MKAALVLTAAAVLGLFALAHCDTAINADGASLATMLQIVHGMRVSASGHCVGSRGT